MKNNLYRDGYESLGLLEKYVIAMVLSGRSFTAYVDSCLDRTLSYVVPMVSMVQTSGPYNLFRVFFS